MEENLWLACRECNAHKAAKTEAIDNLTGKTVKIFNPRTQNWNEHFDFTADKTEIIGKTPYGRATVESLQMKYVQSKIVNCYRLGGKVMAHQPLLISVGKPTRI